MDAGDPSPQPRWLGNYAFRDRPFPPSSLLLSSPFLQVISFWIMFYLGSCFDFFLIMHLLDEEVTVGSGLGRGCRWPWSWDSILTQGTGLSIFPFLKKILSPSLQTPHGWKKPWAPISLLTLGGGPVPTGLFLPPPMFLLGSLITGGVKNDLWIVEGFICFVF